MGFLKRFAIASSLLLIFAASSTPGEAQDLGEPDKNLAKELKNLAEVCYKCGENAREKGIYTYARSFYDYALRYDLDHKETRKVLGYKKKKNEWVLSGELAVPSSNTCKPGTEKELLGKLWPETLPVREKAADALFKFVEDKKLDRAQRLIALYHIIQLCDTHAKSRAVLNHVTNEGLWISALDQDAAKDRASWAAAAKVEKTEDKTPYEEKLKITFSKFRGERVLVQAYVGNLSESMAESCARMGDASIARAYNLLGLEMPAAATADVSRYHFTVFNVREDYAKFVENCSGIDDNSKRREAAQASGCGTRNPFGTVWLNTNNDNDESQRDAVAHAVGSFIISAHCGWNLYWLTRGFAYFMSTQMMGSTKATVFASMKSTAPLIDSGGVNSLMGLGTCAEGWRWRIARTAATDKLATLTQMTTAQVAGYDEQRMAQAFCLVDYLVNAHREKLSGFLKGSVEESKKRKADGKAAETPQEAQDRLLKELGQTEDDFNKAFREWVLATYINLPQ